MNQQNSDEHNYVNRISSEIVSRNAATLRKPLTESRICNEFHFVRFRPHKSHKYKLWGNRGYKETMCWGISKFRKKNVIQKSKSKVN